MNVVFSRPLRIVVVSILLCVSLQAVTEAKLIGRLRNRHGNRGDGNVTSNAPIAPAGLSPEDCDTGNCVVQAPGVRVQVGRPAYMPPAPIPQAMVVQSQPVAVVQTRVVQSDLRVERLMVALEKRLGIEPTAAMSGNPAALLNELPKIELVRKRQDGTVEDSVELDTKLWVIRQLGLKEDAPEAPAE